MSHDEFRVSITDDIIRGLLLFVEAAEPNDDIHYAYGNEQEWLNKAREWLAVVRNKLDKE